VDAVRWGLPVRRLERRPDAGLDPRAWPATVPAVAQLLREGLDLGPATVLVGENGSGKSTLVEGLAAAFGVDVGGGSANTRHRTPASEAPLGAALRCVRGAGGTRWGYFLRAETTHGLFGHLERLRDGGGDGSASPLLRVSHGESFLQLLDTPAFDGPGLYLMDEPESALSSTGCLALLRVLHELAASGTSQVVLATHSPLLAALPGARILEVDADGLHERAWEELALVAHWRGFLDSPQRYLRHLLA
jgi:predicted ATPase